MNVNVKSTIIIGEKSGITSFPTTDYTNTNTNSLDYEKVNFMKTYFTFIHLLVTVPKQWKKAEAWSLSGNMVDEAVQDSDEYRSDIIQT